MTKLLAGGDEVLASDEAGPSPRSFGLTFAFVFAAYGLWPLWHHQPVRVWALAAGAALLTLALLRPGALTRPSRWWLRFGLILHAVVNPIVMGLLFYGAVTPFAAVWRSRNRAQVTQFRPDPTASTYWIERDGLSGSMRRQF